MASLPAHNRQRLSPAGQSDILQFNLLVQLTIETFRVKEQVISLEPCELCELVLSTWPEHHSYTFSHFDDLSTKILDLVAIANC